MHGRPAGLDRTDPLANPKAERIRKAVALAGRSAARRKSGQFLVEGPQAVREAVAFARDRIRDVFVSVEIEDLRVADVLGSTPPQFRFATPEVIDALSSDSQGFVAVVDDAEADITAALAHARLVAVLANVRDPGNLGTVIRVADAAGADAVIVADDSVDVTNPKVVRSTVGSLFHLPVVRGVSLVEAVDALHEAGLAVYGADGSGSEIDLSNRGRDRAVRLDSRHAWVFGNEAWGLTDESLELCDAVGRIPIHGKAESLNLASAASVCLYASATAQRAQHPS